MPLNEGQTVQYTVTTTRVNDGTILYWKTTGNTTNSDIVSGNTGSITITNNRAYINVTMISDRVTDGTKTLGITLLSGSLNGTSVATTSTPIVVEDASQSPAPYTVEYLVVAGGGGSGDSGYGTAGGGGAGGMLSGSFVSSLAPTFTLNIGAGGSGGTGLAGLGTSGSVSTISSPSPGFTTVTAFGGGRGGVANSGQSAGSPGGSGGGAATTFNPWTSVAGGTGVSGQGNPGGDSFVKVIGPAINYVAGGGGGAGLPGGTGNDSTVATPAPGGVGGNGLTWTYTGPAVYYAGGGAGIGGNAGGLGGGGSSPNSTGVGSPGSVNTGGGGAGGYPGGGAGGSGVIILTVPTGQYPGSAPGATVTTPPAAPGKTVLTYTSSGTYTA